MALHKYDPPELLNASTTESFEYQTPSKAKPCTLTQEDSPISIMSENSRRDLNEEFEASVTGRPTLITKATGWGDDSSDDEDDDLL